jgi:hypothetical protein
MKTYFWIAKTIVKGNSLLSKYQTIVAASRQVWRLILSQQGQLLSALKRFHLHFGLMRTFLVKIADFRMHWVVLMQDWYSLNLRTSDIYIYIYKLSVFPGLLHGNIATQWILYIATNIRIRIIMNWKQLDFPRSCANTTKELSDSCLHYSAPQAPAIPQNAWVYRQAIHSGHTLWDQYAWPCFFRIFRLFISSSVFFLGQCHISFKNNLRLSEWSGMTAFPVYGDKFINFLFSVIVLHAYRGFVI